MKITAKHFGTLLDGTPVTLYTMAAENGAVVQVLDYGVTIRGITVPDRSGNPVDVALGYDTLEEYTRNDGYLGAVVGRFANRIADGRFTLNGKEYRLACNDGDNHLHGGTAFVWRHNIIPTVSTGLSGPHRFCGQGRPSAAGQGMFLVSNDLMTIFGKMHKGGKKEFLSLCFFT